MTSKKRLTRLVKFYERKKDEAAQRLAAVRTRLRQAEQDLNDILLRYSDLVSSPLAADGEGLDLHRIRRVDDYKAMLRKDADRKRVDIESIRREEREARESASDYYKKFRMWQSVEDRRKEDRVRTERALQQKELDDLSLHRLHVPGESPEEATSTR